jgi:hypothetical protein
MAPSMLTGIARPCESGCSRIASVIAVAEPRGQLAGLVAPLYQTLGGDPIGRAVPNELETSIEELHARLDIAPVMAPESEQARSHARAQRGTRRRGVARGERRRRRRAVIDEGDEHRLHQPADAR